MKKFIGEVLSEDEMLKIRGGFDVNEEKDNMGIPTPPTPPPVESK